MVPVPPEREFILFLPGLAKFSSINQYHAHYKRKLP
jgi:hypothetical protein